MSIVSDITIRLEYRTMDGQTHVRELAPGNFFDLDLDAEAADSLEHLVWTHNHAMDHLDVRSGVVETTLDVQCIASGERIWEVERFWNDGKCRSIFRRETVHGREVQWLRIIEIHTHEGIHFMRFGSTSTDKSDLISHDVVTPSEEVYALFP